MKEREILALEQNIADECYTAYLRHPALHGNAEVLRLLETVSRLMGNAEDEIEEGLRKEYDYGEEEGIKYAVSEYLKPLIAQTLRLSQAIKDKNGEAMHEIVEEIEATIEEWEDSEII